MSKRTSEANKAITLAWKREQELVKAGQGTRNWTREQQQDILNPEIGKAHDSDGRAFEGQHMKSVEKYPEYQGNPDNIQFLTKEEHLEAHKGSWLNPTNWYYDPITKEFTIFAENELIPCSVIDLNDPLIIEECHPSLHNSNLSTSKVANNELKKDIKKDDAESESKKSNFPPNDIEKIIESINRGQVYEEPKEKHSIGNTILSCFNTFASTFLSVYGEDEDYSESIDSRSSTSVSEKNYPDERASPRKHTVSGYDRMQNGKLIHIDEYSRGGHKDEDNNP